jgi:hypothetical protein
MQISWRERTKRTKILNFAYSASPSAGRSPSLRPTSQLALRDASPPFLAISPSGVHQDPHYGPPLKH